MNVKIYKFINLDYLEMMSDGDESMKKVMLEMLITELPQEISKMKELLAQKDGESLSSVSHKLKSTLAFVGNDEMTEANIQIEQMAKSATDSPEMQEAMNLLEKLYPSVISEIEEEVARL